MTRAGLGAALRKYRWWIVLAILGLSCAGAYQVYSALPLRPPPELVARALDPQVAAAFVPGSVLRDCDVCPELVVIPAGEFDMRSEPGSLDERPRRRLVVPSFALGRFEVTQAQWRAVMGTNPSHFATCGEHCPVDDTREMYTYLSKLSKLTGLTYRLPSAAEWEYAARAGGTTRWSHGDTPDRLGDHAWYRPNADETTHPVGQKRPNGFGLYDMAGNVWEWVDPCNGVGSLKDALNPVRKAQLAADCLHLDIQGGSWIDGARELRPAFRLRGTPSYTPESVGTRVARDLQPAAPPRP